MIVAAGLNEEHFRCIGTLPDAGGCLTAERPESGLLVFGSTRSRVALTF